MKRITSVVVFMLVMISWAQAQTDKGDWMVGGSMTLSSPSNTTHFSISPAAAHFFANNFAVGGAIEYSYTKTGSVKTTGFAVGPMLRYYFNLKNDQFKPFLGGEFSYNTGATRSGSTKTTYSSWGVALGGGLSYFINQNVALESSIGWTSRKAKNSPASDGVLFKIGFRVHLLAHEVSK